MEGSKPSERPPEAADSWPKTSQPNAASDGRGIAQGAKTLRTENASSQARRRAFVSRFKAGKALTESVRAGFLLLQTIRKPIHLG
jgi:hypothetical protein